MFAQPNRIFQAGLNQREARRQREKNSISLRRKDREQKLQNKRKKVLKERNNTTTNQITPGNTNNSNHYSFHKSLTNLQSYIKFCYHSNPQYVYEALKQIRLLLSHHSSKTITPPIKQVFESGCLPHIIQFLNNNDLQIQYEATWIVANIISIDKKPEYTSIVVRHNALTFLLNLLKSHNYPLQEVAIHTLGNIAGESRELRDMVVRSDIMPLLINICKRQFNACSYWNYGGCNNGETQYLELLKTLSWMISNLCRSNDYNEQVIKLIVKCTGYLLQHANLFTIEQREEIYVNVGWSYKYLTDGPDGGAVKTLVKYMNKYGMFKELIGLLNGTINAKIYTPIIKCFGSMISGNNDWYTQICVENGILNIYYKLSNVLVNNNEKKMLKEIIWAISNVNASQNINYNFIESVQNENIFPMLCHLLMAPNDISNEALWAIGNAINMCNNNNNFIDYLCDENGCDFIKYLCHFNKQCFVNGNYAINKEVLLNISLECIESILVNDINHRKHAILFEQNGGIDFLEYMQTDENISEGSYNKIISIIGENFGINDSESYFNTNDASNGNNNRQFGGYFSFGCNSNGNDRYEF